MWRPYDGRIFQNWSDISKVCINLDLSLAKYVFLPMKANAELAFFASTVNMFIEGKFTI